MKETLNKKRPSGDIEEKQVSVKLARTSSKLHYHSPTSNDDMDSIESVIEKGFEHLGQILTPIVSRRRQLSENLASENNSPSKKPKITGLKTGCTVSRGSGRQKYLGSVRRPFTQSKPIFPFKNQLVTNPLTQSTFFKPIFPKSLQPTKNFQTTRREEKLVMDDDQSLNTKTESEHDTEVPDSLSFEDLKNTQNTSQESVESSTQDDSGVDPSYRPSKNVSTESSSTGDHSKSAEAEEEDDDNNDESESEDEEEDNDDNGEESEHDDDDYESDIQTKSTGKVKRSTVVLVDNLHKSSDFMEQESTQTLQRHSSDENKKFMRSPRSRESRVQNYAQSIGEKGVTYTIAGGQQRPTLSDFLSEPKSDLGGYRLDSQRSPTHNDGRSQRNGHGVKAIEKPGAQQSLPSKEVSTARNKNRKTKEETTTDNKEDEPLLDDSEVPMEQDESFNTEQADFKGASKNVGTSNLQPELTSTPKVPFEHNKTSNEENDGIETSAASKTTPVNMENESEDKGIGNVTDSKSDDQVHSETDLANKSQDQITAVVDAADESNKLPKNYTFIPDDKFEGIYKGTCTLLCIVSNNFCAINLFSR